MFGINWSEMALIAIVALIFIGPKELPAVLRNIGKWVSAARNMAREFQGHVDDLVRETELDEVRRNIRENTAATLNDLANHIDPDRSLREGMDPDKLIAGEGETKDASAAAPAPADLPAPEVTEASPPSQEELTSFAQSISEEIKPGADYRAPADMPLPDTAPIEPLPPKEPTKVASETASEPAKNAGAAQPGRA
jgi:sec-independent protein translocase protein TatB